MFVDVCVRRSVVIDEVVVHNIPRIHDHLPDLKSYPNRHARTKASMLGASAAARAANHAHPSSANPAHSFASLVPHVAVPPAMGGDCSSAFAQEEVTYSQFIKEGDVVLLDIVRRGALGGGAKSFVRAGPREQICWAPGEAVAAIVTCGGLCQSTCDAHA